MAGSRTLSADELARATSHPPDGRELRAHYEGEPVGWVVHLVGVEDGAVAGREIHDVLLDALEPGDGQWPDWFIEAGQRTSPRETRHPGAATPAACCGYLTLDEAPTGTYDICEVCFWERRRRPVP